MPFGSHTRNLPSITQWHFLSVHNLQTVRTFRYHLDVLLHHYYELYKSVENQIENFWKCLGYLALKHKSRRSLTVTTRIKAMMNRNRNRLHHPRGKQWRPIASIHRLWSVRRKRPELWNVPVSTYSMNYRLFEKSPCIDIVIDVSLTFRISEHAREALELSKLQEHTKQQEVCHYHDDSFLCNVCSSDKWFPRFLIVCC